MVNLVTAFHRRKPLGESVRGQQFQNPIALKVNAP
jgi:hypothetical protein